MNDQEILDEVNSAGCAVFFMGAFLLGFVLFIYHMVCGYPNHLQLNDLKARVEQLEKK